jgi:hypothetical protein
LGACGWAGGVHNALSILVGEAVAFFAPDSGPKRSKTDHSPLAVEVSTGPSALDRRTATARSSVRSQDFMGSQPAIPRRHHCRPLARLVGCWHALRGQSGRMRSPEVACQRTWLV